MHVTQTLEEEVYSQLEQVLFGVKALAHAAAQAVSRSPSRTNSRSSTPQISPRKSEQVARSSICPSGTTPLSLGRCYVERGDCHGSSWGLGCESCRHRTFFPLHLYHVVDMQVEELQQRLHAAKLQEVELQQQVVQLTAHQAALEKQLAAQQHLEVLRHKASWN